MGGLENGGSTCDNQWEWTKEHDGNEPVGDSEK